ncbi:MAG: hypothetical protein R3E64_17805 [Halioglobus sp.]
MNKSNIVIFLVFGLQCGLAIGQPPPNGEAYESSPEELDAAFTAEDAAREAARWSDAVIVRSTPDPLANMAASSDLVIRATVASQQVVYDASDMPFTHTTLSILEVLQGNYSADQITVIQEGGPAKNKPDNVIMVSDTHYFSEGSEELLFLALEPDSVYDTRKVAVKQRFCVQNGQVFDENGRGLIYTETQQAPGYRLEWSKDRNPDSRFRDFRIGPHLFSKQFRDEAKGTDSGGELPAQARRSVSPAYQASMDVGAFSAALTR